MDAIVHKINTFQWVRGETFLSSTPAIPIVLASIYLGLINYLKYLNRIGKTRTHELKTTLIIHNLLLTTYSAITCGALLLYMLPILARKGPFEALCDSEDSFSHRGPVVFLLYTFYLSKIYEFLDTIFQVLKKKEPQFLHVFHHVTTLYLCYVALDHKVPYSWFDASLNTFVHVVMYFYYFLASIGVHVWWKKYITTIQMLQFALDIVIHFVWAGYQLKYPGKANNGSWYAFHVANLVMLSFLYLFAQFYAASYSNKKGAKTH